jgi:hypothetical protein
VEHCPGLHSRQRAKLRMETQSYHTPKPTPQGLMLTEHLLCTFCFLWFSLPTGGLSWAICPGKSLRLNQAGTLHEIMGLQA